MSIYRYFVLIVVVCMGALSVHMGLPGAAAYVFGAALVLGFDAVCHAIKETKIVNKPA